MLLPGAVVAKVQERLGNIKVPRGKKQVDKFNPERTNPKYCIYDETFDKYTFTPAWVDFLVEKMNDDNEYRSLYDK